MKQNVFLSFLSFLSILKQIRKVAKCKIFVVLTFILGLEKEKKKSETNLILYIFLEGNLEKIELF